MGRPAWAAPHRDGSQGGDHVAEDTDDQVAEPEPCLCPGVATPVRRLPGAALGAVGVQVEKGGLQPCASHGAAPDPSSVAAAEGAPCLAALRGSGSGILCARTPPPTPEKISRERLAPRELHVLSARYITDVVGTSASGPPGPPPGPGRPHGQLPGRSPPPRRPQHHLGTAHHASPDAAPSLRLCVWASWVLRPDFPRRSAVWSSRRHHGLRGGNPVDCLARMGSVCPQLGRGPLCFCGVVDALEVDPVVEGEAPGGLQGGGREFGLMGRKSWPARQAAAGGGNGKQMLSGRMRPPHPQQVGPVLAQGPLEAIVAFDYGRRLKSWMTIEVACVCSMKMQDRSKSMLLETMKVTM